MKSQGANKAYIIHEGRFTPGHRRLPRTYRLASTNCFEINIRVSISAIKAARGAGAVFNVISFAPSPAARGGK